MEGIQVDLTEFEYRVAMNLAKARDDAFMEKFPNQPRAWQATPESECLKIHKLGATAEIAVCKHFNVYPELSGSQDHIGFDCRIKGKKIDIKSSNFHQAKLLVEKRNGNTSDVDIYILAIVIDRSVWIKGYVYHDDIIQPEMITEPIKGKPAYTMQQGHPKFNKL